MSGVINRATSSEKNTAAATVKPNCLKYWPGIPPMKRTRIHAAVGLAVTLLAFPARAAEESTTNAPAATADPNSFVRFISDRNIFDPDRRARGPGESRRQPERPRNTVIPTLTLVGVMDYSRGRFAFFEQAMDASMVDSPKSLMVAPWCSEFHHSTE